VVTGDSGREAYTAIAWGVGLSHERSYIAGAESSFLPPPRRTAPASGVLKEPRVQLVCGLIHQIDALDAAMAKLAVLRGQ
jgi:hypothetical protein